MRKEDRPTMTTLMQKSISPKRIVDKFNQFGQINSTHLQNSMMYSRPSQLQQAKIQNISKSQTFFKARSNTAKNKNINRLPYGGQLLCEAEIINELIDHNQYYRVLK